MAKFIKCDRCGKEFELTPDKMSGVILYPVNGECPVDLCPGCDEALQKWMVSEKPTIMKGSYPGSHSYCGDTSDGLNAAVHIEDEGYALHVLVDKIKSHTIYKKADVRAQLAEECAELSQAALKRNRCDNGDFWLDEGACDENLIEEAADVLNCLAVLGLIDDPKVYSIQYKKLVRWDKRETEKKEKLVDTILDIFRSNKKKDCSQK